MISAQRPPLAAGRGPVVAWVPAEVGRKRAMDRGPCRNARLRRAFRHAGPAARSDRGCYEAPAALRLLCSAAQALPDRSSTAVLARSAICADSSRPT